MNAEGRDEGHWKLDKSSLGDLVPTALATGMFSLHGHEYALREHYYDVARNGAEIANGKLNSGNLTIGPPSHGVTLNFRDVSFRSVSISLVKPSRVRLHFHGGTFDDVKILGGGDVTFEGCVRVTRIRGDVGVLLFKDCKHVGGIKYPELQVSEKFGLENERPADEHTIEDLDIPLSVNGTLAITNLWCRKIRATHEIKSASFANSLFVDSEFRCRSMYWVESNCRHTSSPGKGIWAPIVAHNLQLKDTVFEGIEVDSEVIATKCKDRETIDLQRANVRNDWETLRDNYTGTLLVFHLLFLAAFLAPIAARASLLAVLGQSSSSMERVVPDEAGVQWTTYYVWELLLFGLSGAGSWVGWLHAVLTVGLVVYNSFRVALTYSVAKLRAREDHLSTLGFQLTWPARAKYKRLSCLHWHMRWLLVVAVCAGLWKVAEALSIAVRLPSW
jgi:hypothetical protein